LLMPNYEDQAQLLLRSEKPAQRIPLPTLGGCLLVDPDEQTAKVPKNYNNGASLLLGQPVYGQALAIPGG